MSSQPPAKRQRGSQDGFPTQFATLAASKDGRALYALLRAAEERPPEQAAVSSDNKVAAAIARSLRAGLCGEGVEALQAALRGWLAAYAEVEEDAARCRWRVLPLVWLCAQLRKTAIALDKANASDRQRTKLVEVLREQFQKVHRDRRKREGCLVVCCELLRLYFHLGQAAQCTFLLAAVSQSNSSQEADLEALPTAVGVTLCYFWGKRCVLDGKVTEANEKLSWALAHCSEAPGSCERQRRRILALLLPCKLRLGSYAKAEVLRRHNLDCFESLSLAVRNGDVRGFSKALRKEETNLIRAGTYLVVSKLRVVAYRNLCRRVYKEVALGLQRAGKAESLHKQDLKPYEIAFAWQDDFDADETMCMLAHLIYIGAIRGYMSDEHRKIVFSKDNAFPATSSWCPQA
eukprot:TRINITY_DN44661_c0_g1_i1.p1 TRINITY_DN44661_c0_g1~~TRINITY_DN44661_c0_g1_i1.p1  ORF type:complete len:404 (-),score=101.68 TRINITY_DN44661_c0_g1_i1:132-1343(-)